MPSTPAPAALLAEMISRARLGPSKYFSSPGESSGLEMHCTAAGRLFSSMAAKMDVEGDKVQKFRVLNGMLSNEKVLAGQPYKIVIN